MHQDPYDPDTNPGAGPRGGEDPDAEDRLGQVDRKLGTRTIAGSVAIVLALAAAIVAVVLAIDAKDNSASKNDLKRVERQLGGLAEAAGRSEDVQGSLNSLSERIDANQDAIEALQSSDEADTEAIEALEREVDDLRKRISELRRGSGGSGPG